MLRCDWQETVMFRWDFRSERKYVTKMEIHQVRLTIYKLKIKEHWKINWNFLLLSFFEKFQVC